MSTIQSDKEQNALLQLSKAFANIPFNKALGLELISLTPDYVEIKFNMVDKLIGNFLQSILHGGVISSVLDMAGGMVVMASAVHHYLSSHENADASFEALANLISKAGTINLNINFLQPGKGQSFIAKATLTKAGRKISFAQMELLNQDQILIANGSGSYAVG